MQTATHLPSVCVRVGAEGIVRAR